MANALRVDDTDPMLQFGPPGAWSAGPPASWNKDGTYKISTNGDARFYILFRGKHHSAAPGQTFSDIFFAKFAGTGLSLYGHSGEGGGRIFMRFDGKGLQGKNWEPVDVNGSQFADGTTPIFQIRGLEDGDHELLGWCQTNAGGSTAWIDYIQ